MKHIWILTLVVSIYVSLLKLAACRAMSTKYSSIGPALASTPTPPSDTANRKIYGWNCVTFDGSGNATIPAVCRGDPNSTHVKGVAYVIQWSAYEPTDGAYNENYFTTVRSQINPAQYYVPYILTGAGSLPNWLKSLTTNSQAFVGQYNYTQFGMHYCDSEWFPIFTDSVFVTKWKALVAHVAAQYASDTQIARMSIPPVTDIGFHIGQPFNCPGNRPDCGPNGILRINGGLPVCGGTGLPPNSCCGNNYVAMVQTTAPGVCGASACGTGTTGRLNYEVVSETAVESDWTYEHNQFVANHDPWKFVAFFSPTTWPDPASVGGDPPNTDPNIDVALFPQVNSIFGPIAYVANESVDIPFLSPFCQQAGYLCGAQMQADLAFPIAITQVAGNGTETIVTATCSSCTSALGITAGDSVTLSNTGNSNFDGTHTALASPAPINTWASGSGATSVFSFSSSAVAKATPGPGAQVIDTTTSTSNCLPLEQKFQSANNVGGPGVLWLEVYLNDIQRCPVSIATQYAAMPN